MPSEVPPIVDVATDPLQYDHPGLKWDTEGGKDNHNRQLFREILEPVLHETKDKKILDIGCGQGWLCAEVANRGGEPTGIDPSLKNTQLAAQIFPGVNIIRNSLEEYAPHEQFDIIFLLMVEVFLDLTSTYRKIARLLRPGGQVVAIVSDFAKACAESTERESLAEGELAVCFSSQRYGRICDIVREVGLYIGKAEMGGVKLRRHTPLVPPQWHPRHTTYRDRPIFHLLHFAI